jgi:hypothetical protein
VTPTTTEQAPQGPDESLPIMNFCQLFTTKTPIKKTITCVKGKLSKKVQGTKCPAGYKKKG